MTAAITTNAHDNGFDIVAGTDITGRSIARVHYADGGLVLRIDGDSEDYLPDSTDEAAEILARAGYELTAESLAEVAELGSDTVEQ